METENNQNLLNQINSEFLIEAIRKFNSYFENLPSMEEKRFQIESIVDTIYWNGETRDVTIDLWGSDKKPIRYGLI